MLVHEQVTRSLVVNAGQSKRFLSSVSSVPRCSPSLIIIAARKSLNVIPLLHVATEPLSNVSEGVSFEIDHAVVETAEDSFFLLVDSVVLSAVFLDWVNGLLEVSRKQLFKLEVRLPPMSGRNIWVLIDIVEPFLVWRILFRCYRDPIFIVIEV